MSALSVADEARIAALDPEMRRIVAAFVERCVNEVLTDTGGVTLCETCAQRMHAAHGDSEYEDALDAALTRVGLLP